MEQDESNLKSEPLLNAEQPDTNAQPASAMAIDDKAMGNEETLRKVEDYSNDNEQSAGNAQNQLKNIAIWDNLKEHTIKLYAKDIPPGFWPEERDKTDEVTEELIKKRVLMIRSPDEEWQKRAVQRLAGTLLTNKRLPHLLVREARPDAKLKFGFWKNQPPLTVPVLLVITIEKTDFIQTFIEQTDSSASELTEQLRQSNLYIVCNASTLQGGNKSSGVFKNWLYNIYAWWAIPVLKLHLLQRFQRDALRFIAKLESHPVDAGVEKWIFQDIQNKKLEDIIKDFEDLPTYIENSKSETNDQKSYLAKLLEDGDEIEQVLIFCGAFFEGLHYPDFFNLVNKLLENEIQQASENNQDTAKTTSHIRTLDELWRKNTMVYMKKCMLKTQREGGNNKVGFKNPKLASLMTRYIMDEQYPIFYGHYQKIENNGYIIDLNISNNLELKIIQLFSNAAGLDMSTHNAAWLKGLVMLVWNQFTTENDGTDGYRRQQDFIAYCTQLITKRIPLIIKGLLSSNGQEYKAIIKDFLGKLLKTKDARIIAIALASGLYNDFKNSPDNKDLNSDLLKYIWQAIEEGDWMDSFFAYDELLDNFSNDELWEDTNRLISDESASDSSWKKRYAYLYQLDYILITLSGYYGAYKGESDYVLWAKATGDQFPTSFNDMLKRLFSETSIKNLQLILDDRHNKGRLRMMVRKLEMVEFGIMSAINERFSNEVNTVIPFLGDVLETWFYLLTRKVDNLEMSTPPQPLWLSYFRLIKESVDTRTLREINKYWNLKNGYYSQIIKWNNEKIRGKPTVDQNQERYNQHLFKRRVSLRILFSNIPNTQT